MRSIINFFLLLTGVAVFLAACDKADTLPVYKNGNAPVLSASSSTIATQPTDSNATALTLNWTSPKYSVDSSKVKYTVEMDSAGKNFANPFTKVVTGSMS